MTNIIPDDKRRSCADSALMCNGTAYIFERRASNLRWKVNILSFLGIALPVAVGAIYGTYNLNEKYINLVFSIAGTIALFQLIVTIWSFVANWNKNLVYYLESKTANYRLDNKYDELTKNSSLNPPEFQFQFQVLNHESEYRASLDNQYDITDKEKRMGMRHGLRKYQRKCPGCNKVPTTMEASDCGICGDF